MYGVADRGAESIAFVRMGGGSVFAPLVSRMYVAGEMDKLQRMVTKFARVTLMVSLPVALGLIFFGQWFLTFFYGPQFAEGREALAILSMGQLFSVAMGPVGMILIITGHEAKAATAIGWPAGATIILNLPMVPRWGLEGAPIANATGIVVLKIVVTPWTRTGLRVK